MVTEAFWVSVAMLFYLSREKLWQGVETEGCLTSSNATKQIVYLNHTRRSMTAYLFLVFLSFFPL